MTVVLRALSSLTLVLLIFLSGCSSKQAPTMGFGPGGMPAVAVRAVAANVSDVPLEISAIGNVEAVSTVDVKSRVAGQILKVHIQEGQDVRQGQLLFDVDPEPLLRQIAELEANLAKDIALEKQARANIVKDNANLKQSQSQADRGLALGKEGIFSKEQVEQVVATAESARASLDADRAALESATASIAADRAKLAETKLQLSYTKIVAPISGRAGVINSKEGTLIKDNDTALVTILQTTPVYISFGVPEQLLPEIRKYDAQRPLLVMATSADITTPVEGKLSFIDNAVDTTTGTIKLKATFQNEKRSLWPGQFVNVQARLNVERGRILIPSRTVQTGPQGKYVWVMNPADSTVAMRAVQVLRNTSMNGGDQAVVGTGLTAGEMVISEGQMRLMPGAKVRLLQPSTQSGATEQPKDNSTPTAGV